MALDGTLTSEQAIELVREQCDHNPQCWPKGSLQITSLEQMRPIIRSRFYRAMELTGICCGYDFLVYISHTLSRLNLLYTAASYKDNINFNNLQNYLILLLQITRPSK